MNNKIDFVVLWVDGNDPEWQKEKAKYTDNTEKGGSINRYRDWDNLHYWFRGVEKFAPWVNKVHFVTYGHLPSWLNTKHPKLNVVMHKDFIPKKYLPTFSSHPIELNLHRLPGLAEKFVYFNDDMFIIDKVLPSDFFYNELPCDSARMCQLPTRPQSLFNHTLLNNLSVINKYFTKKNVIKRNLFRFINPQYGIKTMFRNFIYIYINKIEFSSFVYDHLPAPYLKRTLEETWDYASEELDATSRRRFRDYQDVNQYVFRYWQFLTGNFHPIDIKEYGKGFSIPNDLASIYDAIDNQKHKMICINDNEPGINFEDTVKVLNSHFERILPDKSNFEL